MSRQGWCPNGHGHFDGWACPMCSLIEESRAREERDRKEREKRERREKKEREDRQREEDQRREQEREEVPEESEEEISKRHRYYFAVLRECQNNFKDGCSKAAKLILSNHFSAAETELLSLIHNVEKPYTDGIFYDNELLPHFLLFEVRSRSGIDGIAELQKGLMGRRFKETLSASLEQFQKVLRLGCCPDSLKLALKTLQPWTNACAFCEESMNMSTCYMCGKKFCSQHGQVLETHQYKWHRCQEHLLIRRKTGFINILTLLKCFILTSYYHGVLADNAEQVNEARSRGF